jgi:hypothetical protein
MIAASAIKTIRATTMERARNLRSVGRFGRLILILTLVALPLSAQAQSVTASYDRSPALRIAPSSAQSEAGSAPLFVRAVLRSDRVESPAQVIPVQGSMPMVMVMPGETMFEMAAGACAAGVLVGIIGSVALPPFTGSMILTNSAIGCGVGIAATVAATAGMAAARAIANRF